MKHNESDMSSITYGLVEEHYALNGQERTSYGIAIYADAEHDGTTTVIASVHDITADKPGLTALVQQCNRLELSPIHLHDVVEDFLND